MKFVLILLASALSMTQAARFGLLRVDSNGPKEKPATGEFGTRTLQKEDEVSALRELMGFLDYGSSMSMPVPEIMSFSFSYDEFPAVSTPDETTAPTETPAATPASTPAPAPTATAAPAVASPGTAAPTLPPTGTTVDSTGAAVSTDSATTNPSATPPAPKESVDQEAVDQGLTSANEPAESGGSGGPDTSQTILFVVVAFAAVAVGAALMARKFAAGRHSSDFSSSNVSVASAPPQASAADGDLVNVDL